MYSQNNEETIVKQYFAGYSGCLLDIGANDGITYSNSAGLLENGWCGVLLEPLMSAGLKLQVRYHNNGRGIHVYVLGIAETTGFRDFFESGGFGEGDIGLVSTLDPEQKKRWEGRVGYKNAKGYFMTFKDFVALIEPLNIRQFEFITIDAEGYDWNILQQIDLKEVGCRCLCIEHNSYPELIKAYGDYVGMFGLHEIARNAENIIFVK